MRKGENMRQSSEKFMDELLKDSEPAEQPDYSEKISEILDKKIAKAMEKYTAEVEKVNEPSSPGNEVETPAEDAEETIDETIDNTTEEGEENE